MNKSSGKVVNFTAHIFVKKDAGPPRAKKAYGKIP